MLFQYQMNDTRYFETVVAFDSVTMLSLDRWFCLTIADFFTRLLNETVFIFISDWPRLRQRAWQCNKETIAI